MSIWMDIYVNTNNYNQYSSSNCYTYLNLCYISAILGFLSFFKCQYFIYVF